MVRVLTLEDVIEYLGTELVRDFLEAPEGDRGYVAAANGKTAPITPQLALMLVLGGADPKKLRKVRGSA